jgi:hypothetical protein
VGPHHISSELVYDIAVHLCVVILLTMARGIPMHNYGALSFEGFVVAVGTVQAKLQPQFAWVMLSG